MSRAKGRSRTFALVLVLELLFGAWIWFSNRPADAQPAAPTATAPAPAAANTTDAPKALTDATKPADAAKPADASKNGEGTKPAKSSKAKKPLIDDLLPIGI